MKTSRQKTWLNSIVVLVVAALLLELTSAVQYYSTRHSITGRLTEMAQQDLSETDQIAQRKQDVETSTLQLLPVIERLAARDDLDSIRIVIRQMLSEQQQAVGIDFCRVVGADGQREGFYIYKDDAEGNLVEQTILFDYTRRSWYMGGLTGDGFWSEPYMSNYKVILMSTFSLPVRNSEGEPIAVIGADVPLRELSALATQLYDNQQRSLLPVIGLHFLGLLLLAFIIGRSIRSSRRLAVVGAEKERIANELALARRIQLAMLPSLSSATLDRDDLDIYASLTPAREVGGDFYDFLLLGDRLFFCIGDVSGKGVPAALVMAMASSAFRMLTTEDATPEHIVAQMNDSMARDNDYNMFITLFIGTLDLTTGHLRYVNAGHKAPMLGAQPLASKPNLPVGVMPNLLFAAQETTLAPGDTLFLYTDGLTEAENDRQEQFDNDRMQAVCTEMLTEGTTSQALIEKMTQAVESFVGEVEQSDDLTMLAIRYLQKPAVSIGRITLPCDVSQTPQLGEWIEGVAEPLGFSPKDVMQINLAIEEAVVNVMQYAYPADAKGTVEVEAQHDGPYLKFVITDSGQPFDPTARAEADTSLPVEEREVGGLGIHLMRRLMDSIDYQRLDGKNVLTLRKRI